MKIQCACGAKYAFDATPEMLQNPVRFVCPSCGLDSSESVNELIRREFAGQTPAATAGNRNAATQNLPRRTAAVRAGGSIGDRSGGGSIARNIPENWRASLHGLRKTDVPAMHEIVRQRLFAAVPCEGRGAKYQHARLCRAIGSGRGAILAEGRRHCRLVAAVSSSRRSVFGPGMRGSARCRTRHFPSASTTAPMPANPRFAARTRSCSCTAARWRAATSSRERRSGRRSWSQSSKSLSWPRANTIAAERPG